MTLAPTSANGPPPRPSARGGRRTRGFGAAVLLLAFLPVSAPAVEPPAGQTGPSGSIGRTGPARKAPVIVDRILGRPSIDLSEVTWLPDSERILFTLGRFYEPQKSVVLSTRTGREITVEGLTPGVSSHVSGDGKRLGYFKEGAFWVLPLDVAAPSPRSIARIDMSLNKSFDEYKVWCWGPDDRSIYYTQKPRRPPPAAAGSDQPSAVVFDPDAAAPAPVQIWELTLAGGKTRKVSEIDSDIRFLQWSKSGAQLFAATVKLWGYPVRLPSSSILAIDPKSGSRRELLHTTGANQELFTHVSPDGKWIAVTYDHENVVYDFRNHVVLIDPLTGKTRVLAPALRVGNDLAWSPDSQAVFARVERNGYSGVHRLGLDGSVRRIEEGDSFIGAFALSPDGKKFVTLAEDGYGRREVRLCREDGTGPRILRTIDDPTRELELGEFKVIQWPSVDGLKINGYLIKPAGFDPARKYPLLVDIHGGGPGSRLYLMGGIAVDTPLEWHLWAARGYVVFVPDYRSSGEYGPGVIEAMRGKSFAVQDVRDVLAGVDSLVAQGFIDPDRLALLGESAGAHRVNVLLPQDHRFRVAVSNEGWANGWLIGAHGPYTGTFDSYDEWAYRTTFPKNPAPWFAEDPLMRLQEITTPTLLIAGNPELGAVGKDTNEYIYTVLRRKGVETRYIYFPDEGHGVTRVVNQKFLVNAVMDWVDKHIQEAIPAGGGKAAPLPARRPPEGAQ